GFGVLVHRAESSGQLYPYKSEDWLRYHVAGLWTANGRPLMLITGPSTARENLLVERFQEAFPSHRVVQGGLSLGTLGDVVTSLDYLERVYGPRMVPRAIVIGISPRFLAEIPRDRPFAQGI